MKIIKTVFAEQANGDITIFLTIHSAQLRISTFSESRNNQFWNIKTFTYILA